MTEKKKEPPIPIYWDACVFLSYVNDEPGRANVIEAMMDEALRERLALFTSQLSIAEVAFGRTEQTGRALDAATEAKIDKLWLPGSFLQPLVDVHFDIVNDAKALIRDSLTKGWSLKAHDAIHFATARRLGVSDFQTYDDKLYKFSGLWGFTVRAPVVQSVLTGGGA